MESALAKILMRLIVIVFGRYEFFGTFGYPELSPQAIQLFSVLKWLFHFAQNFKYFVDVLRA